MRVLLVWSIKLDVGMVGGTQASLVTLANSLNAAGHDVAILGRNGEIRDKDGLGVDRSTPVTMLYAADPEAVLERVVEWFKPDAIMGVAGIVPHVITCFAGRIPAVAAYFVDTYSNSPDYLVPRDSRVAYFGCSKFMVDRARVLMGIAAEVLPPPIDPALYRVDKPGDCVVFINPVPVKGVAVALALAQMRPEIPFAFVAGWRASHPHLTALRSAIDGMANIRQMPNQRDMRVVYGAARILLMPTVSEEAFGRAAIEAQWSGIPVLSSSKGGLAEAVGDGGMVLDVHAPIADWAAALDRLWTDEALYARLSAAARANAASAGCDPDAVARFFLDRMERRIAAHRPIGAS